MSTQANPIPIDARPTIRQYMTPMPHTIGRAQPLSAAHKLMRKHRIRHLPVLDGGKLCGVVTQRDISLVESVSDSEAALIRIDDAMTPTTYMVAPDAPLADIADEMHERKLGSAVVVEGGRVVGIFTTIDALRALADIVRRRC